MKIYAIVLLMSAIIAAARQLKPRPIKPAEGAPTAANPDRVTA
jgi:hypothetical protein